MSCWRLIIIIIIIFIIVVVVVVVVVVVIISYRLNNQKHVFIFFRRIPCGERTR